MYAVNKRINAVCVRRSLQVWKHPTFHRFLRHPLYATRKLGRGIFNRNSQPRQITLQRSETEGTSMTARKGRAAKKQFTLPDLKGGTIYCTYY